ncbi:MAG: hypothetical protein HYV35_06925 [Lentisphaerae bacterium]|nr:hypothetical protein [Lentisphaerota bacterium]
MIKPCLSLFIVAAIMARALAPAEAAGEYLAIKANGSSGVVTSSVSSGISVTIEINAGDYTGQSADWWILAETAGAWYYYDLSAGFTAGFTVTYEGPLQSLSSYEVFQASLPAGTYNFFSALIPFPTANSTWRRWCMSP